MDFPESHYQAYGRYLAILARIERRLDEEREAAEHSEERALPDD